MSMEQGVPEHPRSGQILLEASGNISLDANTIWDLTASTGGNWTKRKLTLEAGGDIIFGGGSQIIDANSWSVTLNAGYSFANQAVLAGIGSNLPEWRQRKRRPKFDQTGRRRHQPESRPDILVNAIQSPKSGFCSHQLVAAASKRLGADGEC